MDMRAGKVALVTGGNKGIGMGIARGLAAEGARLTLTARGADELRRTADELAAQATEVLVVPADVTDEAQVRDLFARTLGRFGRLDILVNNAGAFEGGPLDELSAEAWDRVLAVNLKGPFFLTQRVAREMLSRLPRLTHPAERRQQRRQPFPLVVRMLRERRRPFVIGCRVPPNDRRV